MSRMEDLAERYLERGQLRRAEGVLTRMLRLDALALQAHFHLARVYRRTGQYQRALYHAKATLRRNPNEPNARLNLAIIYEEMGRDKLALHYYKKELQTDPSNAETLWNIGRLYFRKHRWELASEYLLKCFDSGLQCEIDDTVVRLAQCYYHLKDHNGYINLYRKYVKRFPRAAWARTNLGCAFMRIKNYKAAVAQLSKAKRLGSSVAAQELERARRLLGK